MYLGCVARGSVLFFHFDLFASILTKSILYLKKERIFANSEYNGNIS